MSDLYTALPEGIMSPFRGYRTSPYDLYEMNIGKPWKVTERLRHLVS